MLHSSNVSVSVLEYQNKCLGVWLKQEKEQNAKLQSCLSKYDSEFSQVYIEHLHYIQDIAMLNDELNNLLKDNKELEVLKLPKENILDIVEGKLVKNSDNSKFIFKGISTLFEIISKFISAPVKKPKDAIKPQPKFEIDHPSSDHINSINSLKSKYIAEIERYKVMFHTKCKQYEDIKKSYIEKCTENSKLQIRTKERHLPYCVFEKKLLWCQKDEETIIPEHICICNICCKSIDCELNNENTFDTTCESTSTSQRGSDVKFFEEPWKSINTIQNDLKNVDVENKSLHKYLSQLQIERKFDDEVILTSEILQRLLNQGLSVIKNYENLKETLESVKSEIVQLQENHKIEIKEMETQFNETQNESKAKIDELNEEMLKITKEKEAIEQQYVDCKSAESQLTELLENIKEYQTVVDDNEKEKKLIIQQYQDLKARFDEFLVKSQKDQTDDEKTINILSKPNVTVDELKTEIIKLNDSLDEFKARSECLEKELEELTNLNNSLSTQKIKLVQKLDTYAFNQSKYIKASTKSSKLHKISQLEKDSYLKCAEDKDEQIEFLTQEVNLMTTKSAKLEGQVLQLKEVCKTNEELIETLKAENCDVITKNDEYKEKLNSFNKIIDEQQSCISKLHSKLAQKKIRDDTIVNIQEIYEEQKEENSEQNKKFEQTLLELNYYRKKIMCDLCMENEKNIVIVPCHHIFCSDCVYSHSRGIKRKNCKAYKNCPKCDEEYKGFQLLWI